MTRFLAETPRRHILFPIETSNRGFSRHTGRQRCSLVASAAGSVERAMQPVRPPKEH